MNTVYYEKPVLSQFQIMQKRAFDTQDPQHPVRAEMQKYLEKSFSITAEFQEDTETVELLGDISGIIGIICTLRLSSNNQVISQGRGMAILGPNKSRYLERTVATSFSAAFTDASVRASRVLDTFRSNTAGQASNVIIDEEGKEQEVDTHEPATEKQKSYLTQLIDTKISDRNERNRLHEQVDTLTKEDASSMINDFVMGSRE